MKVFIIWIENYQLWLLKLITWSQTNYGLAAFTHAIDVYGVFIYVITYIDANHMHVYFYTGDILIHASCSIPDAKFVYVQYLNYTVRNYKINHWLMIVITFTNTNIYAHASWPWCVILLFKMIIASVAEYAQRMRIVAFYCGLVRHDCSKKLCQFHWGK